MCIRILAHESSEHASGWQRARLEFSGSTHCWRQELMLASRTSTELIMIRRSWRNCTRRDPRALAPQSITIRWFHGLAASSSVHSFVGVLITAARARQRCLQQQPLAALAARVMASRPGRVCPPSLLGGQLVQAVEELLGVLRGRLHEARPLVRAEAGDVGGHRQRCSGRDRQKERQGKKGGD